MNLKKIEIKNSLSIGEKLLFVVLFFAFIISGYFLLNKALSENFLVEIPERGGTLKEGFVGGPRFINPVIAASDTDKDMVSLIYSGLTRLNNDKIVPDLAERYEISEDNLSYTFYLRSDAKFHDKEPVTADDVIFTIKSIQNPEIKSPERSNWEGVSIEKIDDLTIKFVLTEPYAPFLQNTSVGILPEHLWDDMSDSEFSLSIFNTEPIGSGPYQISKINKNNIGIPTNYILNSFDNFTLGEAYIKNIEIHFAKNEEELMTLYNEGKIEAVHSIMPQTARELEISGIPVRSYALPRIFAVFFNQNTSTALSNKSVREALAISVPKESIVNDVLYGYADVLDGPLINSDYENKILNQSERITKAQEILENAGWEKNEEGVYIANNDGNLQALAFTISTANIPELVEASNKVAGVWNQIGAKITVQVLSPGDFSQNIIRPREFDATLFGMVVGRNFDLYAFWHSSQREDPGLNISGYTNITADRILENLRTEEDPENIQSFIKDFQTEIKNDRPAVFLYAPKFIYILPENVKGVEIENIITADERFTNVYEWFIQTDQVLEGFKN